jgi:hypothetical protein
MKNYYCVLFERTNKVNRFFSSSSSDKNNYLKILEPIYLLEWSTKKKMLLKCLSLAIENKADGYQLKSYRDSVINRISDRNESEIQCTLSLLKDLKSTGILENQINERTSKRRKQKEFSPTENQITEIRI